MSAATKKPTMADVQAIENRLLEIREQVPAFSPGERVELMAELTKIEKRLLSMRKRLEPKEDRHAS